jgi:hypothetical protein
MQSDGIRLDEKPAFMLDIEPDVPIAAEGRGFESHQPLS